MEGFIYHMFKNKNQIRKTVSYPLGSSSSNRQWREFSASVEACSLKLLLFSGLTSSYSVFYSTYLLNTNAQLYSLRFLCSFHCSSLQVRFHERSIWAVCNLKTVILRRNHNLILSEVTGVQWLLRVHDVNAPKINQTFPPTCDHFFPVTNLQIICDNYQTNKDKYAQTRVTLPPCRKNPSTAAQPTAHPEPRWSYWPQWSSRRRCPHTALQIHTAFQKAIMCVFQSVSNVVCCYACVLTLKILWV